jgi:hypothetical protein
MIFLGSSLSASSLVAKNGQMANQKIGIMTCQGKNKNEKLLKLGLVIMTQQHYIT